MRPVVLLGATTAGAGCTRPSACRSLAARAPSTRSPPLPAEPGPHLRIQRGSTTPVGRLHPSSSPTHRRPPSSWRGASGPQAWRPRTPSSLPVRSTRPRSLPDMRGRTAARLRGFPRERGAPSHRTDNKTKPFHLYSTSTAAASTARPALPDSTPGPTTARVVSRDVTRVTATACSVSPP